MFICNREHYGFLPMPLKSHQTLQEETENFVHTLIEAMSKWLCPAMLESPVSICRHVQLYQSSVYLQVMVGISALFQSIVLPLSPLSMSLFLRSAPTRWDLMK